MVLERNEISPEKEFTEDILAILQVFACRWNSKRRYTVQNEKNKIEIDITTSEISKNVVKSL